MYKFMRRVHISCVALLAAFIFGNTTANGATPFYSHGFVMGVGIHSGQGRTPFVKAAPVLDAIGATSVRQEVYWGRVEVKPDELAFPSNLSDIDLFVDATLKKGGSPLIVLDYGNKFYDGGDGVFSEEGIAGFSRYAKFVASHFRGRVKFYDVWNEWDSGMGSNKKPRTIHPVETYVKLLRATYSAIKEVDPNAKVFGGVVTSLNKPWIDRFIKNNGLDYLDAFSTHPYLMFKKSSKPEHSIQSLADLHEKLTKAKPDKNIPIYITEIGWPNHDGPISWTQDQTADFLLRTYLLARTRPYIGGIWWYSLVNDQREQKDKESTFGIVDYDYNPKPAFNAYKVGSQIIRNILTVTQVETGNSNRIEIRIDLKDGKRCTARWLSSGDPIPSKGENFDEVLWGSETEISETPFIGCHKR